MKSAFLFIALFTSCVWAADNSVIPLNPQKEPILQVEQCVEPTAEEIQRCASVDISTLRTELLWLDRLFEQRALNAIIWSVQDKAKLYRDEPAMLATTLIESQEKTQFAAKELLQQHISRLNSNPEIHNESTHYDLQYLGQRYNLATFLESDYFSESSWDTDQIGYFLDRYLNVDLTRQTILAIDDILLPNQRQKFDELLDDALDIYIYNLLDFEMDENRKAANEEFRKNNSPTQQDKQNFIFTADGIEIHYNPYFTWENNDSWEPSPEDKITLKISWGNLYNVIKPEYIWK